MIMQIFKSNKNPDKILRIIFFGFLVGKDLLASWIAMTNKYLIFHNFVQNDGRHMVLAFSAHTSSLCL